MAVQLIHSNSSATLAQDSDATLWLWAEQAAHAALDLNAQHLLAPEAFRRLNSGPALEAMEESYDQLVDRLLSRADAAKPPPPVPARAEGLVRVVGQPRRIPIQLLAS